MKTAVLKICANCSHDPDCTYPRKKPVQFCEDHSIDFPVNGKKAVPLKKLARKERIDK